MPPMAILEYNERIKTSTKMSEKIKIVVGWLFSVSTKCLRKEKIPREVRNLGRF